jgi:hypothetical protein
MRDRLALAQPGGTTAEILDVIGNVSEWLRDAGERGDEPCWGTGVFHDPVCDPDALDAPGTNILHRSDWTATASTALAGREPLTPPQVLEIAVGFRCAWPAAGP